MKKNFLSIFLLFSILTYGAGHIEEISQLRAIRSNKEFTRYKFRIAESDNVQKEIVKILEPLPGA